MAGSSVGFLNLAYMMEVSVVLNLAYRELKFPDLYRNFKDELNSALVKISNEGIEDEKVRYGDKFEDAYPEYIELKSLEDNKTVGSFNTDVDQKAMRFLESNIKSERSYNAVNRNIIFNVVILLFITAFSGLKVDFHYLFTFDFSSLKILMPVLWMALFLWLSWMIVFPLKYLWDASKWKKVLFGKDGSIKVREQKIIKLIRANKNKVDNDAGTLKVRE